jgi:hypothetical protein
MPAALATSHYDGYRIHSVADERPDGGAFLSLQLYYLYGNKLQWKRMLWEKQCDKPMLTAELPKFRRLEKLLGAFVRFFNEGGTTDVVLLLEEIARNHIQATVDAELVASESEETHARTFLLPDGNYLCVVEDNFSEICTPDQLQDAMRREAQMTEGDDLGLTL